MKKITRKTTIPRKFLAINMDAAVVDAFRKHCIENCLNMTALTTKLIKDYLLSDK